ncbi:FkbM family methyltransferase [Streptomyces sp. NPDC001793]|uniref:FkbM family methyltransferase n=1 Tax=Streptomyces sp. NPDC001793 TaxID=3154657 RepID=UPI00332F133B
MFPDCRGRRSPPTRSAGGPATGCGPVRTAVAAEAGSGTMVCHPDTPGNSGLYADREADGESSRTFLRNRGPDDSSIADVLDGAHVGETIEVAVTTVSDIFREHGSPDIALLKTDVERAGMDALRGIREEDWSRIHGICRKRIWAAVELRFARPPGGSAPGRRGDRAAVARYGVGAHPGGLAARFHRGRAGVSTRSSSCSSARARAEPRQWCGCPRRQRTCARCRVEGRPG